MSNVASINDSEQNKQMKILFGELISVCESQSGYKVTKGKIEAEGYGHGQFWEEEFDSARVV